MREWDKVRYSVKKPWKAEKSWEYKKKRKLQRTENSNEYIIQRYQFNHMNHLKCGCHKRDCENR